MSWFDINICCDVLCCDIGMLWQWFDDCCDSGVICHVVTLIWSPCFGNEVSCDIVMCHLVIVICCVMWQLCCDSNVPHDVGTVMCHVVTVMWYAVTEMWRVMLWHDDDSCRDSDSVWRWGTQPPSLLLQVRPPGGAALPAGPLGPAPPHQHIWGHPTPPVSAPLPPTHPQWRH